jgi:hypothetical protein
MGRTSYSGPVTGSYFCYSGTARLAISLTDAVVAAFVIPSRVTFRISEIDIRVPQAPADLTNVKVENLAGGTTLLSAATITGLGTAESAICKPSSSVAPGLDLLAAQRNRVAADGILVRATTPATAGTYEITVNVHGYFVGIGESLQAKHINVVEED